MPSCFHGNSYCTDHPEQLWVFCGLKQLVGTHMERWTTAVKRSSACFFTTYTHTHTQTPLCPLILSFTVTVTWKKMLPKDCTGNLETVLWKQNELSLDFDIAFTGPVWWEHEVLVQMRSFATITSISVCYKQNMEPVAVQSLSYWMVMISLGESSTLSWL